MDLPPGGRCPVRRKSTHHIPQAQRTPRDTLAQTRPTVLASQLALVVKNLPANVGAARDRSLSHGSGRSPGGGRGSPLQYSRLENPMDRGAWRGTVSGAAKSWTRLGDLAHT